MFQDRALSATKVRSDGSEMLHEKMAAGARVSAAEKEPTPNSRVKFLQIESYFCLRCYRVPKLWDHIAIARAALGYAVEFLRRRKTRVGFFGEQESSS